MPSVLPRDAIEDADAVVALAQQVRKFHRRRQNRSHKQRAADIDMALMRIQEAMKPIRSAIGAFPYGPQTTVAETNRQRIRDASEALQRERRKLWKLKSATKVAE